VSERERPPDEPPTPGEDEDGEDEPGTEPPPEEEIEDPLERDPIKYVWKDGVAPLAVTLTEGPVEAGYAPAELVARLAEQIALLLKDLGGGIGPMLYAVAPGSMTLFFGDPDPVNEQAQLAINRTATHAGRVAELIELDGDALYARALEIGAPARQYAALTQLVGTEDVTLRWAVQEQEPRTLTSDRAAEQHKRLSEPGETKDRSLRVHGVLYRVITEPTVQGYTGSVGIHLHSWSSRPPGDHRSRKLIARYESSAVEDQIKAGLVGEPVEARLTVREPVPGASLEPERFQLVVDDLIPGPPEDSILGSGLLDEAE